MKVKEVMTNEPACCVSSTSLRDVAEMMIECDCGEIPVVDDLDSRKPIGVVTDRDIVCRTIAKGLNPLEMNAGDCMSEPCVTVSPETTVVECCRVLQENHIRRVPVVDASGSCCGIVALADVARHAQPTTTGKVVREVSDPEADPSTVH
jgi:CBS domain-containing protein